MKGDVAVPGSIERGQWAETLAERFLQAKGLTPLERNYRCKSGEIDLIMRERDMVVFVEVRYRHSAGYGSGADSVTARKRRRLIATAQHYMQRRPSPEPPCRFDVVSISSCDGRPRVDWIQGAFDT